MHFGNADSHIDSEDSFAMRHNFKFQEPTSEGRMNLKKRVLDMYDIISNRNGQRFVNNTINISPWVNHWIFIVYYFATKCSTFTTTKAT